MESNKTLRISGIVKESTVDGPGIRYVIFTQGCPHKCIGCHNPQTHDYLGGYDYPLKNIIKEIVENPLIQGITLSGGEPFSQAVTLTQLIKEIKKKNLKLNIISYTGYLYENLLQSEDQLNLLKEIDFLIDGPFELKLKNELLLFRGSSNQRVIDVKKSLKENKIIIYSFREDEDYEMR